MPKLDHWTWRFYDKCYQILKSTHRLEPLPLSLSYLVKITFSFVFFEWAFPKNNFAYFLLCWQFFCTLNWCKKSHDRKFGRHTVQLMTPLEFQQIRGSFWFYILLSCQILSVQTFRISVRMIFLTISRLRYIFFRFNMNLD